jgi:hypothetical protein
MIDSLFVLERHPSSRFSTLFNRLYFVMLDWGLSIEQNWLNELWFTALTVRRKLERHGLLCLWSWLLKKWLSNFFFQIQVHHIVDLVDCFRTYVYFVTTAELQVDVLSSFASRLRCLKLVWIWEHGLLCYFDSEGLAWLCLCQVVLWSGLVCDPVWKDSNRSFCLIG